MEKAVRSEDNPGGILARTISPGSPTSAERPQGWTEVLDDWLYVYEGEPDAGHSRRRVVKIQDLRPLAKKQKAAGIPGLYRSALLTTWREERANPGARELVVKFLRDPIRSLYLWGPVGTGKTHLACTIGNELLDCGRMVLFRSFPRLLLDLRMTFSSQSIAEGEILRPLFEADFLLLDEVGDLGFNSDPRASYFTASRLLLLVEQRAQTSRPTIMTSNAGLDELVRWSGDERIGSRIRGVCGGRGIVELTGRDLRFHPEREEVLVP